jgi:hypothetical protein
MMNCRVGLVSQNLPHTTKVCSTEGLNKREYEANYLH